MGEIVTEDLEVKVHRREVSQFPEAAFQWGRRVLGTVGLLDCGLTQFEVLQPNNNLLVQQVKLDHPTLIVIDFAGERSARELADTYIFDNDELEEKHRYMEQKYHSLIKRMGASQDDIDAIEEEIMMKNENR